MKFYKNYSILQYLLILTIFFGCTKDKIVTEVDDKNEPPTEVGIVKISGTIKNTNGIIVPNVKISVHQNGKKIGEILSDFRGNYSTESLPINPNLDVTLEYQKQGSNVIYKRFDGDNKLIKIYNPLLGSEKSDSSLTNANYALVNPSDTNLVKIWGYTKLANGTPVRGVECTAAWELKNYSNRLLWPKAASFMSSDEQGYFELLVPKNKKIYFKTFYLKYPDSWNGQCAIEFQHILPNVYDQWSFNDLGEFQNDTQINLRTDINIDLITLTVRGKALRCDGSPVQNGQLNGFIMIPFGPPGYFIPVNNIIDSNYTFGPNGEFEFYIEACREQGKVYGLAAIVKENNFEGRVSVDNLNNPDNIGVANLCDDYNDYPDDFTLKLGDEPVKNYLLGGDYPVDQTANPKQNLVTSFAIVNGDYYEYVYFSVMNFSLGIQKINGLQMEKGRKTGKNIVEIYETTFKANPNDLVLNITKIEDPYVSGTINGSVVTPSGSKSIDISFRIYNK